MNDEGEIIILPINHSAIKSFEFLKASLPL